MPQLIDLFKAKDLTAAINAAPYSPGPIAQAKLFDEKGVRTTKVVIDYAGGRIELVPSAPRGGIAQTMKGRSRAALELEMVHLPVRDTVMADQVQDSRAPGSFDLESVAAVQQRSSGGMRQNLELTLEYHRCGALRGMVYDADGSVLLDVFQEFGLVQQTVNFNIDSATSSVSATERVIAAQRASADAMPGLTPTGYTCFASRGFLDRLRLHNSVQRLLEILQRTELRTAEMLALSKTNFIEVPPFGDVDFIPDGEAVLVPEGIPDFLLTRFGPADGMSDVNSPGLPITVKTQPLPFDKGVALEAQMNVINVPTRPRSIVRLTAE